MELLDKYLKLQKQIYEYFDYRENWETIPLDDFREYYWHLTGAGHGEEVFFAKEKEDLSYDTEDNGYLNEIYTHRFFTKLVYRGKDFTMICVDTNADGNKLLQVFDNSKEVPSLN